MRKRDQDGLHKRPGSPYWWASIPDPDRRGKSLRRSTKIEIEQDPKGLKAAVIRAQWVAEGTPPISTKGPSWDELMVLYLKEVTSKKRDSVRDLYACKHLRRTFSGRVLAEITAADVRGHIAHRVEQGAAAGTINKEIGLMSAAITWAQQELDWPINSNPWLKRKLTEPPGRDRWLTHAEAQALHSAAEARAERWPWLADFIKLGLYAGFRPGEMLGLPWQRVDLQARVVRFIDPTDQKNGKRGLVPLNDQALQSLIRRASFRASHCPGSPWVFTGKDGKRILRCTRPFTTVATAAGLPDVHPHDLRRTFGSRLVQAGVGIERVSELLRHGSVAITAQVYAHLRESDLHTAVAVLDLDQQTDVSHSAITLQHTAKR